MKRGHKIYPFIWLFVLSLSLLLGQQNSSYLTQKLMVESDLRSRIASALSKIIDDQKYVIDVDVNIEVTGEKEEQITIIPSDRAIYDEASALDHVAQPDADGRDLLVGHGGLRITLEPAVVLHALGECVSDEHNVIALVQLQRLAGGCCPQAERSSQAEQPNFSGMDM